MLQQIKLSWLKVNSFWSTIFEKDLQMSKPENFNFLLIFEAKNKCFRTKTIWLYPVFDKKPEEVAVILYPF